MIKKAQNPSSSQEQQSDKNLDEDWVLVHSDSKASGGDKCWFCFSNTRHRKKKNNFFDLYITYLRILYFIPIPSFHSDTHSRALWFVD